MRFYKNNRTKNAVSALRTYQNKILKGEFSFACLNLSQFLGVLNDNLYKLLMIFLLISSLGIEKASSVLSATGALYVLPFLLFSASAGVLADRFSKQKLIRILKGTEVLLMLLALLAFYTKSTWGCYTILFFLATHSAVFGPSKYGIIPEIVDPNEMTKANSQIIAFTYLATIFGTFLASFLTDLTQESFVICVFFCLLFAIVGFISSWGIKKTPPQKSDKSMTPFFISDIVKTILECRKTPLLAPCLFGSAYFLFIGAFTQLNVIPFAIQSLHLSEYAGGYLFLLTAFGIAGGSFLSSKILKKKLSLGTSCFAGLGLGITLILIWFFSSFLIPTAILLTILGVFGGVFVISFETFIQVNSPLGKRGQAIGAANFLGFFGVLIASLFLYLLGDLLALSAATGFFYMGILTLFTTALLSLHLLEVLIPFLSRLFSKEKNLTVIDPMQLLEKSNLFLVETFNLSLLLKASFYSERCRIFILSYKKGLLSHFLTLSPAIYFLPPTTALETILSKSTTLDENTSYFIILNRPLSETKKRSFLSFSFKENTICYLRIKEKEGHKKVIMAENLDV